MFTAAPPPRHDTVRRVVEHVTINPGADLSTAALAGVSGVSPRHLTRFFLADLGQPPARFVRHARLETAAQLVSTTSLPLPAVAARCGFGSAEALRQAFVDRFGIPPSRYRAIHTPREAA